MTIGALNGIIMGVYLKNSIPLFFVFVILMVIFIFIKKYSIIKGKRLEKLKKIVIIYLISLLLFFELTLILNNNYNNKYKMFDGEVLKIKGTIISDIEEKEYKKSCKIRVEEINGKKIKGLKKGDRFLLNIKKNKDIKFGDEIEFVAEYNEPDKARNYKGFDYKNYLKTEKIYGILKCNDDIKTLKKNNLNIFTIANYHLEKKFEEILKSYLPQRVANLEIGILLGYSKEIDNDIQEAFMNSNITHMLAVSGENTMYVILVIGWLCNKKIFGKRGQKVISIVMIFWFVKLTGSTLSVLRAGITTIIYLVGDLLYKKNDIINTIAIAVLISIIENPFNIFNVGMQLSYAGTISIIVFCNLYNKKANNIVFKYILDNIILTLSANILIIPIMMYHFNTISLTFLLSNLIVGPLVGIATIIGFLLIVISMIFPYVSKVLAVPLNILLEVIIKIAEFFSKFKTSKVYVTTPGVVEIIIMYLIIFITYIKLKNRTKFSKKLLAILIIFLLIFRYTNFNYKNNIIIHFIDVGQGDCCLIITPHNKKILVDGGGSESSTFDVGKNILIPYLLDRKIKTIDYMIVSHFDTDHVRAVYFL